MVSVQKAVDKEQSYALFCKECAWNAVCGLRDGVVKYMLEQLSNNVLDDVRARVRTPALGRIATVMHC